MCGGVGCVAMMVNDTAGEKEGMDDDRNAKKQGTRRRMFDEKEGRAGRGRVESGGWW